MSYCGVKLCFFLFDIKAKISCRNDTSVIKIAKGGKAMNCKAIFGVMGLAVKKGDEVTLTFEGADEDAAYEAVSKFMQETL